MKRIFQVVSLCFIILLMVDRTFSSQEMVDTLNGLKAYLSSFDDPGIIQLSYDVVVEKPAFNEKDALEYANQSIITQSKKLFIEPDNPDLNSISEMNRNAIIQSFREGAVHFEKKTILLSGKSTVYRALSSEGDLVYEEKEEGGKVEIIDRANLVYNQMGEEIRSTKTSESYGPIRYHFFFLNWYDFLKFSEINKIELRDIDENTRVLSCTFSNPDYRSDLYVTPVESYYVPIKYVITFTDAETRITYEDYIKIGRTLFPSVVVLNQIPNKNTGGLLGLTGPYNVTHVFANPE